MAVPFQSVPTRRFVLKGDVRIESRYVKTMLKLYSGDEAEINVSYHNAINIIPAIFLNNRSMFKNKYRCTGISGLNLSFSIIEKKPRRFGCWLCYRPQVKIPMILSPIEGFCLVLSV